MPKRGPGKFDSDLDALADELSLNGNPLRRELWRLTANGRRVLAELPRRDSR